RRVGSLQRPQLVNRAREKVATIPGLAFGATEQVGNFTKNRAQDVRAWASRRSQRAHGAADTENDGDVELSWPTPLENVGGGFGLSQYKKEPIHLPPRATPGQFSHEQGTSTGTHTPAQYRPSPPAPSPTRTRRITRDGKKK